MKEREAGEGEKGRVKVWREESRKKRGWEEGMEREGRKRKGI